LKKDRKEEDYDFEGSEVNEEYGTWRTAAFVEIEVTGPESGQCVVPIRLRAGR
jgi:hypothetical protein